MTPRAKLAMESLDALAKAAAFGVQLAKELTRKGGPKVAPVLVAYANNVLHNFDHADSWADLSKLSPEIVAVRYEDLIYFILKALQEIPKDEFNLQLSSPRRRG